MRTTAAMKDTGLLPLVQVSYHGRTGNAVPWFPYGYHANPAVETLAVALMMEANPEAKLVFCGSPTLRPAGLAVGEVMVYSPVTGSKMIMKNDGDVEVTCTNLKVVGAMNVTGAVTLDSTLDVSGDTSLTNTVTSGGQDIGGTHTHGGVQTGAGTSGPPNS